MILTPQVVVVGESVTHFNGENAIVVQAVDFRTTMAVVVDSPGILPLVGQLVVFVTHFNAVNAIGDKHAGFPTMVPIVEDLVVMDHLEIQAVPKVSVMHFREVNVTEEALAVSPTVRILGASPVFRDLLVEAVFVTHFREGNVNVEVNVVILMRLGKILERLVLHVQ